ncbi:Protein trichome birefringence [Quillaja saponaria]|uniref:Protein trichome birefringence n=1 Tax=Quillaja saponaria TaxID=32244 RepID=A0AAD7QF22_QUISA|nr:Protein trichome birefringence [Quillaja saponaria]
MASFKKLWFTLLEPRTRNLSYPFTRPRIHFLVVFFLLLSLFLISSSLTDHSSTATHTTLSSPYLSASNYTIDVSAITSSNTHFVSDVQSNCTLNSITTAVEKSHGIPRNAEPDMISDLASCNIFDGNWILDASDPVYQPGSCPYLDDAFNCFKNGRPDSYYLRYRWKPHGCHIPRGGQWNSGGNCDGETHPITNVSYLGPYPWMMSILETVIAEMKTPVFYLNITKMSDYRKDGHPSIYRQPGMRKGPRMFQDCSHWCLPGIPDSWNELLYATLLISHKYVPVTKYLNESTANLGSSSTQI